MSATTSDDITARVAVLEHIARDTHEVLGRIERNFEQRFEHLEQAFERRFDRMDARMDRMDVRIDGLHRDMRGDFRLLLTLGIGGSAALLTLGFGLLATMAHGFHWI